MEFSNPFDGQPVSTAAVWVGSAGGSLAYGLSKTTSFDLVAEIGTSPELIGGAFLLAGGVALASDFGLLELEGDA